MHSKKAKVIIKKRKIYMKNMVRYGLYVLKIEKTYEYILLFHKSYYSIDKNVFCVAMVFLSLNKCNNILKIHFLSLKIGKKV